MKNKLFILTALSTLGTPLLAQDPRNSDIKVTADIAAGCYLTAENINFGVLNTPISDTTAQSQINVQCSKDTKLDLDITYGVIFTSSQKVDYKMNFLRTDNVSKSNDFSISRSQGENGVIYCYFDGRVFISEGIKDLNLSCSGLNNKTVPTDWTGDLSGSRNFSSGQDINIGALKGISNGEQIVYSLEIPNDSSKIWSKGANYYSVNSTGSNQTIPMKAHIKRSNNVAHKLSADTYQSYLTVELTY